MPIGVPKVSYRLPGEPTAQWVDIYNRLYRDRILFLGSTLDDELANQLVGIMIYLSAEDPNQDIFLYINSPGGSVTAGLAVFDTMNQVRASITTVCIGTAASMASLVLAGGEPGKRTAFNYAQIMLHQPVGGAKGQASDVVLESREVLRMKEQLLFIYTKITGQSLQKVKQNLERDYYLDPLEAKSYGVIDTIINHPVLSQEWSNATMYS